MQIDNSQFKHGYHHPYSFFMTAIYTIKYGDMTYLHNKLSHHRGHAPPTDKWVFGMVDTSQTTALSACYDSCSYQGCSNPPPTHPAACLPSDNHNYGATNGQPTSMSTYKTAVLLV